MPETKFQDLITESNKTYLGERVSLERDEPVGFGTLLKIQFARENTVGNLIANIKNGQFGISKDVDLDFDPYEYIPEDKQKYYKSYITANSIQDVNKINDKIDRELEYKKILNRGSLAQQLVSGLIAGTIDPVNLIPIVGVGYKTGRLGKIAYSSLSTAAAGFVSEVAVETLLQSQQETRTLSESAMNIAGSTILAGILGGAGALLRKGDFNLIAKKLEQDLHTEKSNIQIDPKTQDIIDTSVGARQYTELRKAEVEGLYKKHIEENLSQGKQILSEEQFLDNLESIAAIGGAKKLASLPGLKKLNPLLRVFNSKSIKAKQFLQNIGIHNMLLGKNVEFIRSQHSVELEIKNWNAGLGQSILLTNKSFKKYSKRIKSQGLSKEIANQSKFNESVSKSLRRGDISDIPEVAETARTWRREVFDPLKDAAIELGLLPRDVKVETAVSYLTRMYNTKKIIAQEPILRKRIQTKLKNVEMPKIKEAIEQKQKTLLSQINDFNTRKIELTDFLEKGKKELLEVPETEIIKKAKKFKILESFIESEDTRGKGIQYHGTSTKIKEIEKDPFTSSSIYGQGFYTTDAKSIALGYSKKRGRPGVKKERTVYKVNLKKNLKLFDMEKEFPVKLKKELRKELVDYEDLVDDVKNMRELYDEIREVLTGEHLTIDSILEYFAEIQNLLQSKGYDGYVHRGGLLTKRKEHKVEIYWNPKQAVISLKEIELPLSKKELTEAYNESKGIKPEEKYKSKKELLEEAKGIEKGLTDDDLFNILDNFLEAEKTLKLRKPKSLLQYIKENGGIYDEGGELLSRGITNKNFPFLIRKNPTVETVRGKIRGRIGVTFDDVALRAWEDGYFPHLTERPTINHFLEMIDEDLLHRNVFSENEMDLIFRRDEASKILEDIDRYGIDIDKIKKAKSISGIELDKKIKLKTLLLDKEIKSTDAQIKRLDNRFKEMRVKDEAFIGDDLAENQYIEEITDSIMDNLKGFNRHNVNMPYDLKITKRGPLKERTLNFMDDAELEDFLENDIEKIGRYYTKVMGTDVELQKKFGSLTLEPQLEEIRLEYDELGKKAKTEIQRKKIADERVEVIRDLEAMRDIMRGNYGIPNNPDSLIVRGFRISRQMQYITKLGGIVVSSLPDIPRIIFVHGYGRVFKTGLKNLITNLEGIKLNVKEAKYAGNIIESVAHTRLATIAELTDPYASGSVFERFLKNLSNNFSKISGMTTWNDIMKSFTSVLTQQRLIVESRKLLKGTIKKKERIYLAFLGIDKTNVNKILKQVDEFGFKQKNLWVANTKKWTDPVALRLYRNALNLDVDRTIITKTIGDVPLFMNRELGKTLGQFKSFTLAATQQALIAGLQQADLAALEGLISGIAMGALVYYLKTKGAGREPSKDFRKYIAEGIDRSGIFGILMEANNIAEKLTRGKVGINSLTGGEIMSRYASRNLTGTFVGPSSGTIEDLAVIIGAIATGEIKQSDIRAFRRMTPYQNLFYIRWLFDALEDGINKNLGN